MKDKIKQSMLFNLFLFVHILKLIYYLQTKSSYYKAVFFFK